MIVKANVVDKVTGLRSDAYFLVRFDHTPFKGVKKHHRRTGLCSIYYLSDEKSLKDAVGKNIDGQFFASRICGEKYKYFLCDQSISCNEKDKYCKAYARIVTMQKALTWIIENQTKEDLLKTLPFKFDNYTFKSFITTLNKQHSHGYATAMKLIKNPNYRISMSSKNMVEEVEIPETWQGLLKDFLKAIVANL